MASPSKPEFWNLCYLKDETPWEFDGIPADIKTYLKNKAKGTKVLIPGCGSGHEIIAFADAGYDVTAIDFAPMAVERARRMVGPTLAKQVLQGDFFEYDFSGETYDLIYERAFVCSITPSRRPVYRDRLAQLLKYGGKLIGYYYYGKTDPADGPPFGFAWGAADELFARYFLLVKDVPVKDSLPVYAGHERWQERQRTKYQG